MLMREKYGLLFNKIKSDNNKMTTSLVTQKVPGGNNSVLVFMYSIDEHECKSFIYDLNYCLNNKENIDDGFVSDGVEYMKILYEYPNVNLDDILLIPMIDMKVLLEEWLAFLNT